MPSLFCLRNRIMLNTRELIASALVFYPPHPFCFRSIGVATRKSLQLDGNWMGNCRDVGALRARSDVRRDTRGAVSRCRSSRSRRRAVFHNCSTATVKRGARYLLCSAPLRSAPGSRLKWNPAASFFFFYPPRRSLRVS